jgi:hypothetical protein
MLQSEGIDVAINFVVTVKKLVYASWTHTSHIVVTALMHPRFILDDNGMFEMTICSFFLQI